MSKKVVVLSTEHALKATQRDHLLSLLEKYNKSDVEFLLLECGIHVSAVVELEQAS